MKIKNNIILVDENDNQIGVGEKLDVHQKGLRHRAFSVFIFNSKNEILLQKRAKSKYHSGGLWTNSCCGHPRPGEQTLHAAQIRLQEEMGFSCKLDERFSFIYKTKLDNDLCENEYDHIFVGKFNGAPDPNPEEVENWQWISLSDLSSDIVKKPENYTYWFLEIFKQTNNFF